MPSRDSKNAPPAVDKCVKVFSNPVFLIAATVSPPPTIDIKDFNSVFSAIFFAIDKDPVEKLLSYDNIHQYYL